jgi:signal transduction histidine kinase
MRRPHSRLAARTILLLDAPGESAEAMQVVLEGDGHRVLRAHDGREALALLAREDVQVLLVDPDLVDADRSDFLDRVRARDALLQIVLLTAAGRRGAPSSATALRRLAVHGWHDRHDGAERLLLRVGAALATYERLAQLAVSERLKTELLANVSHELRTPLNVIVGYIELLRDGTFGTCPPEAVAVLHKVLQNAGYLLELVEEFLDLAKAETDTAPRDNDVVPLGPLLREFAESFALLLRDRPVRFLAEIPEKLPGVMAEGAKLRVVVQNLLSNAVKFTKAGHVRLSAETLGTDRVAIRVSDTGPGIPPEHHQAIFDVFHQLRPHEGQGKGVGLGLALARRFARLMGGDVTVESAVGEGSTFTVVLPVAGRRALADAERVAV